jgi:lipoate-protein ligase A
MEEQSALPLATWRLLDTGIDNGATNMAIDEAIMQAVSNRSSPPTLRFYGWDPPCVSIGYAQSLKKEIDLNLCKELGYDWVRRITGGRAILHIDEITYSIVAPKEEARVAGDIITSYRRLSTGLVEGLRSLTSEVFQANQMETSEKIEKSAACFDVPSHYEVTALGRKLVGSAQVRKRGTVLQHGALPLKGDVSRLVDVLTVTKIKKQQLKDKLLKRAIALDEVVGQEITYNEAVISLVKGFSKALNIKLKAGSLSPYERNLVNRLKTHYTSKAWNLSR